MDESLTARIQRARARIAPHFPVTRLMKSASFAPRANVYLKLECELPTGSFKVRGALFSLSERLTAGSVTEVVAASTGNHGAAVAYAAGLVGVRATIYVPERPNPVKAARIRELGAALVETGSDLTAAIDAAQSYAERTGAFFLHDASDPNVPVGTATIGAEILEQLPDVGRIYVPMGDTALIRGVASAAKQLRPETEVVGVVAEQAPAYLLSWREGRVVETDSANTIADGLAVRRPLRPNVTAIRELVDRIVAVSEAEMIDAIALLMRGDDVVAEPSGAAAAAALCKEGALDDSRSVVLLVTGRNIAPDVLSTVEARG